MNNRPTQLSKRDADSLVRGLVSRLCDHGLLPNESTYDAHAFSQLRKRVHEAFYVPQTSITPVMARFLFAVGASVSPQKILVLGSYFGNSLVWLTGSAILDMSASDVKAVGYDPDISASLAARTNFAELLLGNEVDVDIRAEDGRAAAEEGQWDLILFDADDENTRKKINADLLENLAPMLAPAATVLVHDTAIQKFADDFEIFRSVADQHGMFDSYAHLPLDRCGIDIGRVAARQREE